MIKSNHPADTDHFVEVRLVNEGDCEKHKTSEQGLFALDMTGVDIGLAR